MKNLFSALVTFRSAVPNIPKRNLNPHYKSKFASLEDIHKIIDPLLAKHGLAVLQFPISSEGEAGCVTRVIHESGESIEYPFTVPIAKRDPQAACAAVSYARRYGISGALGLVTEDDDDGNAASGRPGASVSKKQSGLDKVSKEKLRFAAVERLKELSVEATTDEVGNLVRSVLKKHGYATAAETPQDKFAAIFSDVQTWEP